MDVINRQAYIFWIWLIPDTVQEIVQSL